MASWLMKLFSNQVPAESIQITFETLFHKDAFIIRTFQRKITVILK